MKKLVRACQDIEHIEQTIREKRRDIDALLVKKERLIAKRNAALRKAHKKGARASELARQCGMTSQGVSKILRGLTSK